MRKLVAGLALVSMGLTGCGGGGGGGGGGSSYSLNPSNFVNRVNKQIGSDDLSVVKTYAIRDGWAVVLDDVYGYRAIDISFLRDVDYSVGEAAEAYLSLELEEVGADRLVVPTGYPNEFVDEFGFIYEENTMVQKDLELVEAIVEQSNVIRMGEKLAADYGLSEDAGLKIARVSQEWEKLSESRAMTDADVDALTGDLFGISLRDIRDAEKAFAEGDAIEANRLMDAAAENIGTSPENFRRIVFEFVGE